MKNIIYLWLISSGCWIGRKIENLNRLEKRTAVTAVLLQGQIVPFSARHHLRTRDSLRSHA